MKQRGRLLVATAVIATLFLVTGTLGCDGSESATTTTTITGDLTSTTLAPATTTVAPTTTLAPTSTTITLPEIIPGVGTVLYENEEFGFSLYQPEIASNQTTDFESYMLPLTKIPAAAVILPESLFAGTNLYEAGVYIGASSSAEAVSGWNQPAPDSLETALGITDTQGVDWAGFTATEGAAGNAYEQQIYRTVRDGTCYEIVQLLHWGQFGNFPEGSVVEFDKAKFQGYLDAIARSFQFTSA